MSDEVTDRVEPQTRLGRGIAALIGASEANNSVNSPSPSPSVDVPKRVPIEFLRPNPKNPRKRFKDEDLAELADSIKERGVIQPILVRAAPHATGMYEIVAGERRWRAAQRAGQYDVPILVLAVGDREALEIAIVENIQRADLNALEEAAGFAQLGSEYGYSQADIARIIGKSRSHVANTLRLFQLPDHAKGLLAEGLISAGHARALLGLDDPNQIADRIVQDGLTVRDVERLSRALVRKAQTTRRGPGKLEPDTRSLQEKLQIALGTKVTIRQTGQTGELRIVFRNADQLDELYQRLVLTQGAMDNTRSC